MSLVSRRGLLSVGFSLLAFVAACGGAFARPISNIVAFGDSLTDNGNLSALAPAFFPFPSTTATGGQSAYLAGHLSNGTTWVEDLATSLNVPLTDRAYAGAFTNTQNTASGFIPAAQGMQTSVNNYVSSITTANPNTLYVLWGGANNYFSGETNPVNPLTDLSNQVNALVGKGAKQFLIVNLPRLGNTPGGAAQGTTIAAGLNALTDAHNAGIASLVSTVDALAGVDAKLLDVNALFTQVQTNPTSLGLPAAPTFNAFTPYVLSGTLPGQSTPTQGYNPTIIDPSKNVDNYLFYDEIHPTAAAHRLIGARALATITVPETGAGALVGIGGALLGVCGMVVRRRRTA